MVLRRLLPAAALAALLLAAAPPLPAAGERNTATVAHIKLTGNPKEAPVQADPLFGTGGENFKSKIDRIKKAKNDASIQALLLEIDDLGVGWGKTDELRRAVA